MPLTDQHRFGMQLAQMSRGWRAELDRRLAGLGLSQARWLVLLHLARFEDARPNASWRKASVSKGRPSRACSTAWKARAWCNVSR